MDILIIAIIVGPAIYTLVICLKCLRDYIRCDKEYVTRRRKLKRQAISNGALCLLFTAAIGALFLFLCEAVKHM